MKLIIQGLYRKSRQDAIEYKFFCFERPLFTVKHLFGAFSVYFYLFCSLPLRKVVFLRNDKKIFFFNSLTQGRRTVVVFQSQNIITWVSISIVRSKKYCTNESRPYAHVIRFSQINCDQSDARSNRKKSKQNAQNRSTFPCKRCGPLLAFYC